MTAHALPTPAPAEGEAVAVPVGDRTVVVARVAGTLYAADDECTHAQCSLAGGDLDGTTLVCPCHFSEFDLTSGAVLAGPATEPLRTYAVREDGDGLVVDVQS